MLNTEVFKNIQDSHKKILVVTKYWDRETTQKILREVQEKFPDVFWGLWENRLDDIKKKYLDRKNVHFIGNIQSRNISEIVEYSSVIHSLSSLKHAQKIEAQWQEIQAFIQIHLDPNKDIWFKESELMTFLEASQKFNNLKIIWVSGMASWENSPEEKRKEFQKLIRIRNNYLPGWLISAGTSRDYNIALTEGIDIVRVGNSALSSF